MRCSYCNKENYDYVSECVYCHNPIYNAGYSQSQYPQQNPQPQYQYASQPQTAWQQQQQPLEVQELPYPPPPPPQKKKGLGALIGGVVAVVVIIVILAALFLFVPREDGGEGNGGGGDGVVSPGATVSTKQFWDEWNTYSGDFNGLSSGDSITIRDTIKEIEHIDTIYDYDIDWTLVTFESTDVTLNSFYYGDISTKEMWGMMIFDGDLTYDYGVGDLVDVTVYITEVDMDGRMGEIPDWFYGIAEASAGDVEYHDIDFPGISRISHVTE